MAFISGVTGSKGYAGIGIYIPDPEPEYKGTTMFFAQTYAPVGWTQAYAINDMTLRVTTGSTLNDGGTNPFSATYPSTVYSFPAQTSEWLFSDNTHFTTIAEMPPHLHYAKSSAFVNTATTHALGPTLGASLGQVHIPGGLAPPTTAPAATAHNVLPYISPLGSPTSTGEGHSHGGFSGGIKITSSSTLDLRIKYIYVVMATKTT